MSARDVAFTLVAIRDRCTASEKALPVAEYRVKLAQLHNDMLDEIARLNAEIAAKSDAYRDNIAAWMTKYGDKAAECHEYRLALERIASGETGLEPFPHRNMDRAAMKAIAAEAVRG